MKKINVKPAKTITLEFEDGIKKELKFNAYSMMILDDEFEEGSLKTLAGVIKKPFANGAKIIYSGMKAVDENVTLEEAKNITANLSIEEIMDITNIAADSVVTEDSKKKLNNMNITQEQTTAMIQFLRELL